MLIKYRNQKEIENDKMYFYKEELNIVEKKSFKRLGYKTQVVPNINFIETTHLNNRMTHSLKVAIISKLITTSLKDKYNLKGIINKDQINNISLLHDIGHPPVGHYLEKEMNNIEEGLLFEGNANNLVIIEKEFINNPLSRRTVLGTIKYPQIITTNNSKGIYIHYSELLEQYKEEVQNQYNLFKQKNKETQITLSSKKTNRLLETQIMEVADDMAYLFHDFIDMFEYNKEIEITKINDTKINLTKTVYKNNFTINIKESKYNHMIIEQKLDFNEWENIITKIIEKITIDNYFKVIIDGKDEINFLYNLREIESKVFYSERDNELNFFDTRTYMKIFLNENNLKRKEFLLENIKSTSYRNLILETDSILEKKQLMINYIAEMTDNWLIKSMMKFV